MSSLLKRDSLIVKVKAKAEAIAQKTRQIEQCLAQRYGTATAHAIEIGLLLVILGKLFRVI